MKHLSALKIFPEIHIYKFTNKVYSPLSSIHNLFSYIYILQEKKTFIYATLVLYFKLTNIFYTRVKKRKEKFEMTVHYHKFSKIKPDKNQIHLT